MDDLDAAHAKQDYERDANQRCEGRHEHAPGADQLDVVVHVVAIGARRRLDFGFFLSVGADHANAREIFLRTGGKRAERSLNLLRQAVNDLPK